MPCSRPAGNWTCWSSTRAPPGPTGQLQLSGFQPSTQATLWQYGEAQDTAQSQSTTGALRAGQFLDHAHAQRVELQLFLSRLLDQRPGPAPAGPTFVNTASAKPNPVTGTSTALSATATDPAGPSSLTYTWATTGSPPAPVGSARTAPMRPSLTTATFTKAGSYALQVTARDPNGLTATSSVTVVVNQTATSVLVNPRSVTVSEGGTESFTAQVEDQFGNPLSTQPGSTWSVASGIGTIGASTGVYRAPNATGTAVVQAQGGGVSGTANVTISPSTSASATYLKTDATTQGNWIGAYGAQGYDVIGNAASLPSYATITPAGQSTSTWATSTTDPRALQGAGGTGRIAACWYSATSFTVDVNLTDGQAHDLELYFLD